MAEPINDLAVFSDDDVEAVVQDELKLATSRYHRQTYPRAVLLAGQPGAGKTELSAMLAAEMGGDAAFINGDDYRRYHPNRYRLYQRFGSDSVRMISPFSNTVTEQLIAALSGQHFNLIIEGTGRTVEVPKITAEQLASVGYTVEMAVVAARPEISLISTMLRFYQMDEAGTVPRATAISAHDNVVDVLPKNLDTLVSVPCISRLSIWNRELQRLYDSTVDLELPSTVLRGYWNSAWTSEEMQRALADIETLKIKEQHSRLGQAEAIGELVSRIGEVAVETSSFDMNML